MTEPAERSPEFNTLRALLMTFHRRVCAGFGLVLCLSFVAGAAAADPQAVYDDYSKFAEQTFGVRHEPLTTQLPGKELKVVDDGSWTHAGETSACIAWETNLPAKTYVEYGPSETYGSQTQPGERHHYLHLHRLTGLKPGKAVHYRLVSIAEDGQKILSKDQTITPKAPKDAIRIPDDLKDAKGPPYELNQAGKTYILTQDITAPGSAISITAPDVTLDLDGHTIVYNESADAEKSDQRQYGAIAANGTQGVRCSYGTRGSARLLNGTIRQGAGGGGWGHVPVLFRGSEVAGVTIDYHGPQVSGIDNECKLVHHNVIIDRGTEVTNRHQGVDAVSVFGDVKHNLIARCRQRGVNAKNGAKINRNEIHVDSVCTNSFGVMFYKTQKGEAVENKVFGRGYLAIGIGTVSEGVKDITVARNFIHLQSTAPLGVSDEYGDQSGAYCVRVTWGGENIEYVDNVMVSKGRDGGMVRGIWFCPGPKIADVVFCRNTVKVLAENAKTDVWGAVVVSGDDTDESKPGLFEGNTIISNFCNVRLGEKYGAGRNARFVNNTFVREGSDERYRTVIAGFWKTSHTGNVFVGSKFEGGAGFDKTAFDGTGPAEFTVIKQVKVRTTPGAAVVARGEDGAELAFVNADEEGVARVEVLEAVHRRDGVQKGPKYKIEAKFNGKPVEATVH